MSLTDFVAGIPSESIIADLKTIEERYRRNVTALQRRVPFVLQPRNETEIFDLVRRANDHCIPLYPISMGRNWGLGSKLPVQDDCVIVDLSRMNRVLEVNEIGRYAVIEPGVSQGGLADYLAEHHPNLTFNLTGAFAGTSIVGNVLERGDGQRARIDDLLGVSGVLGDGTRFSVGGHCESSPPAVAEYASRYAAGPDLVGLFSQANFAVITRMAFRLLPRPQTRILVWGVPKSDMLTALVSQLRELGNQRVFDLASLNLGYANRFVQAGPAANAAEWQFYLIVEGLAAIAAICRDAVLDRLRPLCERFGSCAAGSLDAMPEFLRPLAGPLVGRPDADSIELIYRMMGTPLPEMISECDVDRTAFGMKCCIPTVPFDAECVGRAAGIVADVRQATGLNIRISFFGDGRALVTIHFRNDVPDEIDCAEKAEAVLFDRLSAAGFLPYRLAINQMTMATAQRPRFFDLVARLKRAFDPKGVIAPGRYCSV
jgi:4-cresol dehydrogenase (hydroxylating)